METNKLLEIQGNVKDESNFFLKFISIGFHLIVERVKQVFLDQSQSKVKVETNDS